MNDKLEFLKYIPTPGERHVGIAVIRYEKRIIFRFKIQPNDKGGFWVTPPALKTGNVDGKDRYEASFALDSAYESELMQDFVRNHVNDIINQPKQKQPAVNYYQQQEEQGLPF